MKKICFIILMINYFIGAFAFAPLDRDCTLTMASLQRDTTAPAKIQLEKTRFNDMPVLFIPDTAQHIEDIGSVFSKDYGELMKYAGENRLGTKRFLAWYYSVESPWILDIAIETDKMPPGLAGRIKSRTVQGGELLIAHMRGPYSELRRAYIQIDNWLKENKRLPRGKPFEVYLNDPNTTKDPSAIETDICQPLE